MKTYSNIDLYGSLSLQLDIECSSSGDIQNFLTNNTSFIRFTGTNPVLHGLNSGGSFNKIIFITFNGNGFLTLKNESSLTAASSRILIKEGVDITINENDGLLLFYNSYISRWCTLNTTASNNLKSISQNGGFNNFSDGRVNLSSTVPLQSSGNCIMDCSSSSFLRKSGGDCIITLNNMSEGQTIKIIFESTGNAYSINWNPSIKWSVVSFPSISINSDYLISDGERVLLFNELLINSILRIEGELNIFQAGSSNSSKIPVPSTTSNAYDLYTIQKIGGMYLGSLVTYYS